MSGEEEGPQPLGGGHPTECGRYLSVQVLRHQGDGACGGMHSEEPGRPGCLLQNAVPQARVHRVGFISVCGTNHPHGST